MSSVRGSRGRVRIEGSRDETVDVSHGWDGTPENLRQYLASLPSSKPDSDGTLWVQAALVPHPHNSYSAAAVSVSAPSTVGSTLASRHLGYLPQRYLDHLGHDTIPLLAEIGGGEVEVMAGIWIAKRRGEDSQVMVALERASVLRQSAKDFAANLHSSESEAPLEPGLGIDSKHRHTAEHEDTRRTLELVGGFSATRPDAVWSLVESASSALAGGSPIRGDRRRQRSPPGLGRGRTPVAPRRAGSGCHADCSCRVGAV